MPSICYYFVIGQLHTRSKQDNYRFFTAAAVSDKNRWPAYGTTDINGNASTLKYYLKDKVEWLAKQWGTTGTTGIGETHTPTATETVIYDLQGRRVSHTDKPGIYIIRNGSLTRKINVK